MQKKKTTLTCQQIAPKLKLLGRQALNTIPAFSANTLIHLHNLYQKKMGLSLTGFLKNISMLPTAKTQAGIVQTALRQHKKFGFKSVIRLILSLRKERAFTHRVSTHSNQAAQKLLLTLQADEMRISCFRTASNLVLENIELSSVRGNASLLSRHPI